MRPFSLALITTMMMSGAALAETAEPAQEVPPIVAGAGAGETIGEHRFQLTFEPTQIDGMGLVRSKFQNEGIFQQVLDALADEIALPKDIPVVFRDCDLINAYWDPENSTLNMCWDLIAEYNHGYEQVSGEEKMFLAGANQGTVLTGTTLFILMHELGHGLVDLFRIPITGREENAVDQFATLLLIGGDADDAPLEERTSRFALLGAYFFKQMAQAPEALSRGLFADEHALGQQRYYDVMCLVLGSNEDAYAPILIPGLNMVSEAISKNPEAFDEKRSTDWLAKTDDLNILPYARAVRCQDEFNKLNASWEYLAETFMKPVKK